MHRITRSHVPYLLACAVTIWGVSCRSHTVTDSNYPSTPIVDASTASPGAAPVTAPALAPNVEIVPPTHYGPEVENRMQRALSSLRERGEAHGLRRGEPQTLEQRMVYHNVPGVSIAFVDNFKVVWARGFGVRRAGESVPVDERTMFQAASVSKPVFATAVMRMQEQGKLSLDTDITEYQKSWKLPATNGWTPHLTLRHLFTHSAGLTVHGFPGYPHDTTIPNPAEVLDGSSVANTDPVHVRFLPGVSMRYSGGGTTIAQLAVTDHLGKPFPALMQEWVLEPYGMQDSSYAQPIRSEYAPLAATGHSPGHYAIPGGSHSYPEMGAAGLWTTPRDLATLLIGVMSAYNGSAGLPLSPAGAQEMLKPQLGPESMGVGFMMKKHPNGVFEFGHSGRNAGFDTLIAAFPDSGRALVAMINANAFPLLDEIFHAILTEYELPVSRPAAERTKLTAKQLRRCVGQYKVRENFVLDVSSRDTALVLKVPQQPELVFQATAPDRFVADQLDVALEFPGDEKKPAEAMMIHQGHEPTRAVRVTKK